MPLPPKQFRAEDYPTDLPPDWGTRIAVITLLLVWTALAVYLLQR